MLEGLIRDGIFHWPVRVYIEDTDVGGIVFYANYLKFMERARTELVRHQGVSLRNSLHEGVGYVVHSLDVRYLAPARLDDLLWVTAEPIACSKTSFTLRQQVIHQTSGNLLVEGRIRVACVSSSTGKPRALLVDVAGIMAAFVPTPDQADCKSADIFNTD